MRNLTTASEQLFRRTPDECFASLAALSEHCSGQKKRSLEIWQSPRALTAQPAETGRLTLAAGDDRVLEFNDWSFSQLCRLSGVAKDTVNRLTAGTAAEVFRETLPRGNRPLQLFAEGQDLRSIHAASYTRLFNAEVISVIEEFGDEFHPPPDGEHGATGLYAGQQDAFIFLIDPGGWTEIQGEAFAPGFFVHNSEVGCRSVGIETFWFQRLCKNHIVWDAVDVVQFTRKHTAKVHEALDEIRRHIETLIQRRDARRDGFARVITRAMQTPLGGDAEEVQKVLGQHGIARHLAQQAVEIARRNGTLSIFALVDALTRLGGNVSYAGQRVEHDQKAARLLSLAV